MPKIIAPDADGAVVGEAPKPRLLFFYAPTDGGTRRLEALLAQVLQRRKNHRTFEITRVDATARTDVADRFGIKLLPSLVVVAERRVQARLEQPRGCIEIKAMLEPWLR